MAPANPLVDRDFFSALAVRVCEPVAGTDRVALHLAAETSHFIRFNHAAVRQATQVRQGYATLSVVRGSRRIESTLSLTGSLDADVASVLSERALLVSQLSDLSDDPYLLIPEDITSSEWHETGVLPQPEALIAAAAQAAAGLDFVGFYAGGTVVRALADQRGQRHWHHVQSFHFDWCLYHAADKAIKTSYAGTQWRSDEFARRVAEGAARLPLLALPARQLPPGAYRAFFTPAAMGELLGTLGWGGFGAKARRTGTSSLARLAQHDARLNPAVTLLEDTRAGIAPGFTADGFAKPAQVRLIGSGLAGETLNSPRSAREYGLPANGANALESPESLNLASGTLADADVLAALGTGLYVSNLWYLNYSDRQACRMTGMTRFACFWVEGGRIVAPVNVMRFDDSFPRMFGDGLVALTDRAELIPESGTYRERQLSSVTTPGALVDGWRLTL